jgi:hypothetical protein
MFLSCCRGAIVSSNLLGCLFKFVDEEFDVAQSSIKILSALAGKPDTQAETHSPDEAFNYVEDFADVLPSEFGNKIAELLSRPQSRALALQLISSFSKRRKHGFSTLSYPPNFFHFRYS